MGHQFLSPFSLIKRLPTTRAEDHLIIVVVVASSEEESEQNDECSCEICPGNCLSKECCIQGNNNNNNNCWLISFIIGL
jgi:hypothetical protein